MSIEAPILLNLQQLSFINAVIASLSLRPSLQVEYGIERIKATLPRLLMLAQGGTAVGTGLNSVAGFDVAIAAEIAKVCGWSERCEERRDGALE